MTAPRISLAPALLKVQQALQPMEKDGNNTFHSSRYTTLDSMLAAVLPVLSENDLVLLQPLDNVGGVPAVRTILIHVTSGESIEAIYPIEKAGMKGANDSQQFGAAISYVRRYGISSLFCLRQADDDAQCVGAVPIATAPRPPVAAPPALPPALPPAALPPPPTGAAR